MRRGWAAALLICLTVLCMLPTAGSSAWADELSGKEAELRALLQKGLTVQEIDRELEKLAAQDEKLVAAMTENEKKIEQSQIDMKAAKVKAGKVLRSYYTGERPSIVMLLLTTESIDDLFRMLDYMGMIISHDEKMLSTYKSAYAKLQDQQNQLAGQRQQLQKTKAEYLVQKERIVTLQAELDALLADSGKREELQKQIDALNEQWKSKGLPLVDRYLTELGESMNSFSELLSSDNFRMTSLNTATFEITDKQLNSFLRSKNHIFDNLVFHFEPGQVIAEGQENGVAIQFVGVYKMMDKEIIYEVLSLKFNDYVLPDTTIRTFNEQHTLGIDPSAVAAFLTAEDVVIESGKLAIKLKLMF